MSIGKKIKNLSISVIRTLEYAINFEILWFSAINIYI